MATAAAFSAATPSRISAPPVTAWNAPAAPPGVGITDPIIDQPSTKSVSETPNGRPNARKTRRLPTATDPHNASDHPIVVASSFALGKHSQRRRQLLKEVEDRVLQPAQDSQIRMDLSVEPSDHLLRAPAKDDQ